MLSEIALWALQAPNLKASDFECSVSEIDYFIPGVVGNALFAPSLPRSNSASHYIVSHTLWLVFSLCIFVVSLLTLNLTI